MTGDRIELTGQEFVVDLIVRADLRAAGASDDLADTIHYGELAEAVHARITGPAFDLIEALADAIAVDTLRDPRIEAVEVTVHKPGAPIARTFADVSVTVCRARSIPIVIAATPCWREKESATGPPRWPRRFANCGTFPASPSTRSRRLSRPIRSAGQSRRITSTPSSWGAPR